MKYIVEVREPVPSNLDEIAGKVAASFHISDDKALALLRRAPGAVTRAVSEREADVVAGIFERAGLSVVKRPAEATPAAPPPGPPAGEPDADAPPSAGAETYGAQQPAPEPEEPPAERAAGLDAAQDVGAERGEPAEPGYGEPSYGGPGYGEPGAGEDLPGAPTSGESAAETTAHEDDVWNRPLDAGPEEPVDAFSRREGLDEGDLGWGAAAPSEAPDEVGGRAVRDEVVADQAAGDEAIELEDDVRADAPVAPEAGAEAPAEDGPGSRARQRWAEEAGAAAAEGAADAGAGAVSARDADVGRRSQTPETMRSSRTPETVRRSQTPETVRSTLTRMPATLERGGLRRRVALSSILPALLTLVVMGVAMLVTTIPLLRAQQAARAADAAHAEASTLEALTGGMPLDSQTLQTALVDLSRRSQAVLGGGGVRLMVVTDATGAPLAGWYGPATTPAAMPPDVRQQVGGEALAAVAGQGQGGGGLTQGLQATWKATLAMLGLGSAGDVYGAAPVMSAGHAIGAVVVGVQPVSASAPVGNAFLTTLLVGLVPLLIAILVAMALTRGLRSQVSYLLGAADRISRGDLEEPVGLDSNDELGQLARAIERMRVSLQEGMERLRNRR